MVLTRCCTPLFSINGSSSSFPPKPWVDGLLRRRFSKNLTLLTSLPEAGPRNLLFGQPPQIVEKPTTTVLPSRLRFGSPKALYCGQAKNEEGRKAGTSWPRTLDGKRPPALAADQTRSAALASPGPHSGRNPIPRDSHREVHLGFYTVPTVSSSSSSRKSAPAEEGRHLTPPTHRNNAELRGGRGLSLVEFRFLASIPGSITITYNQPRALYFP